jgi:hypothetical protein
LRVPWHLVAFAQLITPTGLNLALRLSALCISFASKSSKAARNSPESEEKTMSHADGSDNKKLAFSPKSKYEKTREILICTSEAIHKQVNG